MPGNYETFRNTYMRYLGRKKMFIITCIIVLIIAFGLEMALGQYRLGFLESYFVFFDHLKGIVPVGKDAVMKDYVIWTLRVPRAIAALAIGAGLGVCGGVMQSAMRNPLADPYTTGISSGASLGACLSIILGIHIIPGSYGDTATMLNAFVFALIPAAVIVVFSMMKKKVTSTAMILIGIAVMFIFTAVTTMVKYFASEKSLAEMYIWGIGTIGKASWDNIWYMVIAAVIGMVASQYMARALNILIMCDGSAETLGVNAKRTRLLALVLVSFVAAVMVCFSGPIGFIGLVAPHIVRMFLGSDNRYLMPASAAVGAMVLICSDCVAKSITSTGMPVGLITSMMGGPIFLYLLVVQKKSVW